MQAATRLQNRMKQTQQKKELKRERDYEKMQKYIDKKVLLSHYEQNYGISIDESRIEQLSEKQMLIILETKLIKIKEIKAATKIQAYAKKTICRVKYLALLQRRKYAATRIQKTWRRTKNKCDFVTVIRAYKNMNATRIQRFMRGYKVTQ